MHTPLNKVLNVLMLQVNVITWQLSVVVISRQSKAGVAFLGGTNALQHIKPCNDKNSADHIRLSYDILTLSVLNVLSSIYQVIMHLSTF